VEDVFHHDHHSPENENDCQKRIGECE
jgi:hypothetical protein